MNATYDQGFADAMAASEELVRCNCQLECRCAQLEDALHEERARHDRVLVGRYQRSASAGWKLFWLSLSLNFWLVVALILLRHD